MSGRYTGRLAAFGDPVIDAILEEQARDQEAGKARRKRVKAQLPEKCPGCGNTRMLRKGHKAVICEDCHAGIDAAVARNGIWE